MQFVFDHHPDSNGTNNADKRSKDGADLYTKNLFIHITLPHFLDSCASFLMIFFIRNVLNESAV